MACYIHVCISYKLWSQNALFMKYKTLKIMWPWFDHIMLFKVKGYEVDWNIIYDFVYVFHRNISHIMRY